MLFLIILTIILVHVFDGPLDVLCVHKLLPGDAKIRIFILRMASQLINCAQLLTYNISK